MMPPIRFNPETDIEPTPFDEDLCRRALKMKHLGLPWRPHVGCFVWDPDSRITPDSPFPNRIYFILSLPRFVEIFGSLEAIARHLVWLPTWHQACLLCAKMGLRQPRDDTTEGPEIDGGPAAALGRLYERIIGALSGHHGMS